MSENISMMIKVFLFWLLLLVVSLTIESWVPGRGLGIAILVCGNGFLALATRKRILERFNQAAKSYNEAQLPTSDVERR
jgi:hypothetical protein